MLVRVHQGKVEYRPIAGTRPRGASEAEDDALAEEMMRDEKERAEHVMLVDLGRNDVGRVSRSAASRWTADVVERYSHVMHIVSSIEGELKAGTHRRRRIARLLPCRNALGAPKVRAMEIIEEWNLRGVAHTAAQFSMLISRGIRTPASPFGRCFAIGKKGYVQALSRYRCRLRARA